jgi:uncharacterized protein
VTPDRIVVETWDPGYGPSYEPRDDLQPAEVDAGVEVAAGAWEPIPAGEVAPARDVVFIDGVQRVDARITLVDGDQVTLGMVGSFAAGSCRHAHGRALMERVEVRRGLFTRASDVTLDCGEGVRYAPYAVADTDADTLVRGMTEQMRSLEKVIADSVDADLVVIDGPLSGQRHAVSAVGLIKTHQRAYLEEDERRTVSELGAGERTPLFLTVTSFSRYSWYLRLPGPLGHPWTGIVRCEVSGALPTSAARDLARLTQATLPKFASSPHRDPRAPQNLTPIGSLERLLRHRLGDALLLDRMLRKTCGAWRGRLR